MIIIVGFSVGGNQKCIKWHGWFSRWVVNGRRSGRCKRGALVGFGVGLMVCTFGAGGCGYWLHDCFICCCMGGKRTEQLEHRICGVFFSVGVTWMQGVVCGQSRTLWVVGGGGG